jgi:hypothetical protein
VDRTEKPRYLVIVHWRTKGLKSGRALKTVLDCADDHRKATEFAENLWRCASTLYEKIEVVEARVIGGYA